jgi:putative ABC transport system substrate-binding protein
MKRRTFITFIGGAVASPLVAHAQQPAKMKRIALVNPSVPPSQMLPGSHPFYRALFGELSRLGFVEGKNLLVDRYSAEGQMDRFPQMVREVVDAGPDAIFSLQGAITFLLKNTKTSIPIVAVTPDPVVWGVAASVARPGGNITGVSVDAGLEIWSKRIALIREVVPNLTNLAIVVAISRKRWEDQSPYRAVFYQAAKGANIGLIPALLDGKINEVSYRRLFATFDETKPDAALVNEDPIHFTNAGTLVELAAKYRLPAMYTWKDFAEIGGLMSHAFDLEELGRSSGYQIGQVLSGTNPADIPFIQITRLQLTLNLKTAKSLGIEFPATLLASADFIIE